MLAKARGADGIDGIEEQRAMSCLIRLASTIQSDSLISCLKKKKKENGKKILGPKEA